MPRARQVSEPTVRVKNISGITQVIVTPLGSVTLKPGAWTPLPSSNALNLQKRGVVEIEAPTLDPALYSWQERNGLHLFWMSPFSMGDGYATAAENMVHALLRQNVNLTARHLWFLVERGLLPETIALLKEPITHQDAVGICMATPGEFKKLPTPYRIGWTMYESTEPLKTHPEWRHDCNQVDRLFVPCDWCKDVFGEFVHAPIDVVPLAINPLYCHPVRRKPKDTFTVICYATLTGRKAPLQMLDVFKRAFPRDKYPDCRMHFKTRMNYFGYDKEMLPDLDDDRIKISSGDWFPNQVRDYLDSADVMLYLSLGEGFGMTPREAAARGVPLIVANNTGMSDICDERYNWPVPTVKESKSPLGGLWYEPDFDYAVDVLRWMYEHRETAYDKAYKGAKWLIKHHGPDASALKCVNTLKNIDPWYELANEKPVESSPIEMSNRANDVYRSLLTVASSKTIAVDSDLPNVKQGLAQAGFTFKPDSKVLCSIGKLHTQSDKQIQVQVAQWLKRYNEILVVMPSVYYSQLAAPGERFMRVEQWMDTFSPFAAVLRYSDDKQMIYGRVTVSVIGYPVRRHGQIRENVWRPVK